MGWDFYCDPAINKAALVQKLRSGEGLGSAYKILGTAVVGSHVWRAVEDADGRCAIFLDWIKGGGKGSGWGQKDLPYHEHLDCPEWLIKLVKAWKVKDPDYDQGRFAKWVEQCAEARVAKLRRAKWLKSLIPGERVEVYGQVYEIVGPARGGARGFLIKHCQSGKIYRAHKDIQPAAQP